MPDRVRVFLDTSALFAGIWSASGGARMILKLGEAGAIQLLISPQVLTEVEGALRRKAPEILDLLHLLLNRSQAEVVSSPSTDAVRQSRALTRHAGDAQVLAAAWQTGIDYFVTLDHEHFLDNAPLRNEVPFPIGTPGDFWLGIESNWPNFVPRSNLKLASPASLPAKVVMSESDACYAMHKTV